MSTVDITPSPRVLRMLGQIDFAPWQCLAELIDNSVDAFIDQTKSGRPPTNPAITIQLPSDSEIRAGAGEIAIKDNGQGMTLDDMKNAVRAGYSGNDPIEKMGLFGMGFNISTARLGRRTEVWTTTPESPDWTGLVIDFDDLERSKTFHAPLRKRPKTQEEVRHSTHGTEILISRLEADRIKPLNWGVGKRRTKDRLGKIYGRIMGRMGIEILYDGDRIKPWRHCVWDKKRSVDTPMGRVPAIIEIDETFAARKFCTVCWVWLAKAEAVCPSCGEESNIVERQRKLRGWIGVQRYFDKEHYGIDLIRNGRVIEELDKSMFTFNSQDGDSIFEYPIDAIHWGGRIVGELEIDFVRVSHQKDSFDKLDPEWRQVVEAVRGTSPMQPRIAERMGLPKNESPLARLFAGYRKGSAGLKDLVPGTEKGAGLNSGIINELKDRFDQNEPAFQSDEKWYELVLQAEKAKRGGASGADEAAGEFPVGVSNGIQSTTTTIENAQPAPPVSNKSKTERDALLSRTYEADFLAGRPAIQVEAFQHAEAMEGGAPFRIKPDGYKFQFDYYPKAIFFEHSLDSPLDFLLVDLGQHFLAISSESPRQWPVSLVARRLKERYFPGEVDSLAESVDAASALLDELRRHLDDSLPSAAPIALDAISKEEIARIRRAALQAESATTEEADRIVATGRFAKYVSRSYLPELVRRWPATVFDGSFFTTPYVGVSQQLRNVVVEDSAGSLRDVVWLSEEAASSVNKDNSWRLMYARSLASLRLLQGSRT